MTSAELITGWLNGLLAADLDSSAGDGHHSFRYDDRFDLSLETREQDDSLLLFAAIARPPDSGREAFFAELLAMNHPSQELGGAQLSLNGNRSEVVLSYSQAIAALDVQRFEALLANFTALADRLWSRFQGDPGFPSNPDAAMPPPPATPGERVLRG